MKINSINRVINSQINYSVLPGKKCEDVSHKNNFEFPYIYPSVYFTGKKITNLDEGKNKLLKQLDEILKEDVPEEEINHTEIQYKALKMMASLNKQLDKLYDEAEKLVQDRILNKQQKYDRAVKIKKEIHQIQGIFKRGYLYIIESNCIADEKTDYSLINKFRSAISEDNFNLKKVFQDYYQPIINIQSLKELKKKYPKIQIPQKPENVIARKLESTITRDFYKELHSAFKSKDREKFQELLSSKVIQLLNDNIKIKSQEEKNSTYKRLVIPAMKAITARYYKLLNTEGFSSIPEFRKPNKNLISENDLKLLNINYEDFVLSVLKEQYSNMKNPNEIVYSKNGNTVKVSSLKEPEYKFEKIPGRIIKLVQDAQKVRTSQRDYKNYSNEHFKKKLEFYAEKFDDSEKLLNTIVQFDSCLFGDEDIKMLIKFLNEADKVWDGEKTIQELEDYVYENSIKPTHTEKINAIEQKKKLDAIKAENKRLAQLRNIQNNFDSYINILYDNNLNYLALTCAKYKPETLDKAQIETANLIMGILDNNIHGQKIKNKDKIESQIMRVSTYLDYSISNNDDILLNKAKKHASSPNGLVDIEKAGKYLLNSIFIKNYPQSLDIASNKEIAQKIAQNSDKDKAVEYLCKYDDYMDLEYNEKTKLINILNLFDVKDSTEKFILKNIIEKEYLNSETSKIAKMTDDGSKKTKATIGKDAKNQIYDYYKFPKCLEYFEAFEDALGQFASNRKSSGIKKVLSKDANELKIIGYPDRLFAYNNSYYFNDFSPTGLH